MTFINIVHSYRFRRNISGGVTSAVDQSLLVNISIYRHSPQGRIQGKDSMYNCVRTKWKALMDGCCFPSRASSSVCTHREYKPSFLTKSPPPPRQSRSRFFYLAGRFVPRLLHHGNIKARTRLCPAYIETL